MSLYTLTRVTFRYQQVTALGGLSLSIEAGTRVALLGANGSGKSTLLRLLDGLCFPESGDIEFRGERLTEAGFADDGFAHAFRRRVGLVFQNPDVQLFNPTVFDEVAFGPLQLRATRSEVHERVSQALDRLGIRHLAERVPQRLSGGEKKKVALASVLVMDPDVLLLDEPTAGLDPRSRSQIIDFLVGWGGGAKSVITATHELGDLGDIADHCVVLHAGQLAAERSPADLMEDTELLNRTNLVHTHRHRHPGGDVHSHPHVHRP